MRPFADKPKPVTILKAELLKIVPQTDSVTVADDRVYICMTADEVKKCLGDDSTAYVAEYNDCDDYAWRAKGKVSGRCRAFGAVKIIRPEGAHRLNCYINERKEFVLWEPQTRKEYDGEVLSYVDIIF